MLTGVEQLEVARQWVIDAPLEDAPRQAYADRVEATDPDRAQFIRLELMAARARRAGTSSMAYSIPAGILRDAHGKRWAAPVDEFVSGWSFYRGFVELVVMDAEWFLETAEEIYARTPVLHLDPTDVRPVTEELFASTHLDRIVSLNLMQNDLDDADAILLAESPHLRNLEWLDLSHNQIGDAGLEALAASHNLPSLGYVDFRWNVATDPTPTHADEWDATTPTAQALQEKYGHREWLDARPRRQWPPDRDAAWITQS
jgi:Leucine Rich repeat